MNVAASRTDIHRTAWRESLPVLTGRMVTLRELEREDAPALLALLSTMELARFNSPAPTSSAGVERFIDWAARERYRGACACFAVVPHGMTTAVGLFQLRALDAGFTTAEWGFALGSPFWGTGIFADGARLTVDFAIEVLGSRRLEARAAVANGRGNGALRKIGAVREIVLRKACKYQGAYIDQVLWSIVESEWREAREMRENRVRVH
jgi:RimJ/RimL family protein N-acetyltransferase